VRYALLLPLDKKGRALADVECAGELVTQSVAMVSDEPGDEDAKCCECASKALPPKLSSPPARRVAVVQCAEEPKQRQAKPPSSPVSPQLLLLF